MDEIGVCVLINVEFIFDKLFGVLDVFYGEVEDD